jgi:hypothetical protein
MAKGQHIEKTFQCKEVLSRILDDMTEDYGMTTDYLINVALLEFAHSKGYIDLPNKKEPNYTLEDDLAAKSNRENKTPISKNIPKPNVPKPTVPNVPKPPIPPKPPVPPVGKSAPQLFLEAEGETYPVDMNRQFIIGRGSNADFRITNNPSVSRKHAMVFYKNGKYYIKDMGSTNGFEFEGKKYDIRQISDGEDYSVCDVPFTFKFI